MDKLYVYRARCRADVPVRRDGDVFVTLFPCAGCEVPAGSRLDALVAACELCQKEPDLMPIRVIPTSAIPVLPTVIASPPPGAFLPEAAVPDVAPEPMLEEGSSVVEPLPEPPPQVLPGPLELVQAPPPVLPPSQPVVPELGPPVMQPVMQPVSRPLTFAPGTFTTGPGITPSILPVLQPVVLPAIVTPDPAPAIVAATPVQTAQVAAARPSFASSLTPGANLLTEIFGIGGEESVNIDAALSAVPGLTGGPSRGGFSWHTLELPMHCWRLAYYSLVMGLVPKKAQHALAFGTLYHACWEIWYTSGGARRYDEPCDAVRKAGAPKLAGDVQRLVYVELMKYAHEEATTWDIRAVEQNAVCWGEPERINGKLVYLPFSCRHDMLIGKRAPGAPCAPAGPLTSGIWVVDRKTSSALTYDLTKGYSMDGQFLMNALVYKRSNEEQEFGPFVGMIFAVAVKHKEPTPEKSYFRIETAVDAASLEEFHQAELRPYATELYRRLATPAVRDDPRAWPKCRASCVGRYGVCRFFDICDVDGTNLIDAMFDVDPDRVFKLENLAEPPAEARRAMRSDDPVKAAAETVRQDRAAERKHMAAQVLEMFRAAVLGLPQFDTTLFLVPNHTRKTVLEQLVTTLRTLWPTGQSFPFGPDVDGNSYVLTVSEKAVKWIWTEIVPEPEESAEEVPRKRGRPKTKAREAKGTLTYLAIAEAICRDWWDPKHL